MSRRRMIDPEFWLDEQLALLSHKARLLYIGLWGICDDNFATFPNRPDWIKAQIFPYESLDIRRHLLELQEIKKIIVFTVGEQEFYYLKNFFKYQRVDRPSLSKYPAFPNKDTLSEGSPRALPKVKLSKDKKREVNLPSALMKRITKTAPNQEILRLMGFFIQAVKIIRKIEPPILNSGKVGAILKKRLDIDKIEPARIERMVLWYLTREKKFKDNHGVWQTTFKNSPDMAVMLSDAFLSQLLSEEANVIIYMRDNFEALDKIYKQIEPMRIFKVGSMESIGTILTRKVKNYDKPAIY